MYLIKEILESTKNIKQSRKVALWVKDPYINYVTDDTNKKL